MTEQTAISPPSFSLWHEPWICVVGSDGSAAELSIEACLKGAHTFYALSDASPLVVAGTHRLLTAILQAIYAPSSLRAIATIFEGGGFDSARIDDFSRHFAHRFDLFHPDTPFLQTGDVPIDGCLKPAKGESRAWADPKPVAPLFAEVPATTYRAHFHHVTDESHRVCPACCGRGLITLPAFASSGGAGIRPSINGVPPIYIFPAGDSLFQSLALSLTTPDYQPRSADAQRSSVAAWNTGMIIKRDMELNSAGYLESLGFPARRVRLYPREEAAACTQCGRNSKITISSMLYEMGHRLSDKAGPWDDPFVAFRLPNSRGKEGTQGPLPMRPQPGKALWREYSALLLARQEQAELRPKIVRQLADLIDDYQISSNIQRVRFRCIGLRTDGKAKIFEWVDEALEAPPALLNDPEGALLVEDALNWANATEFILRQAFIKHFRPERTLNNPTEKTARFQTLLSRLQATFWQRLAPEFRTLIFDAAHEEQRSHAQLAWADKVVRLGNTAFEEISALAGSQADALRARVMAQSECRRRLAAKRKEWLNE